MCTFKRPSPSEVQWFAKSFAGRDRGRTLSLETRDEQLPRSYGSSSFRFWEKKWKHAVEIPHTVFITALVTTLKEWDQPRCSSWMRKYRKYGICGHWSIIQPQRTMDSKAVIHKKTNRTRDINVKQNKSGSERQALCAFSHKWNQRKINTTLK